MSHKLNIKQKYLNILYEIFNNYCPQAEIWAYGSRLTQNYHEGSDLDLVVKNFNNKNKTLSHLKQLLNDSNIPFLIDILEFNALDEIFQNNIIKKYVKIYPKQ